MLLFLIQSWRKWNIEKEVTCFSDKHFGSAGILDSHSANNRNSWTNPISNILSILKVYSAYLQFTESYPQQKKKIRI